MATSGTFGQLSVPLDYVYTDAARRCGVTPDKLSPECIDILQTTLALLLSDWGSRGLKLWRIKEPLVGLQPGQGTYALDEGTIDVLDANFRTPQRITADSVTSSNGGTTAYAVDGDVDTIFTMSGTGNVAFDLGDDFYVNLVGLLPGATGALTLVLEYSADNASWSTAYAPGSQTYTNGIWTWYGIEPAHSAQYFRIRSTSGTISMREIYLAQDFTDIPMYRMNRDDFMALPNKTFGSEQVYQYWLDRKRVQPEMRLWPYPSDTFRLMALMTHTYIEDLGNMRNEADVPQRWVEPMISTLALRSLPSLPGADLQRYEMLKSAAMEPLFDAESEEVDKSPIRLTPAIRGYSR